MDLGHNISMTFAFSRAAELGIATGAEATDWLAKADKMMDFVMAHGYDATNGGLYDQCAYNGTVIQNGNLTTNPNPTLKPNWAQAETLRALADWAADRNRDDFWPAFDKTLTLVKAHFLNYTNGSWQEYDTPCFRGDWWGGGYHETMMYDEVLRLVGLPAAYKPGDADYDGDVDGDDFVKLAVNYTGTGTLYQYPKIWAQGDFDNDGDVDGDDFVALAVNYTGSVGESPSRPACCCWRRE